MTPLLASLTRREEEVLRELSRDGATNKDIARRLGIREGTVAAHIAEAMRRTGAATRTELVILLIRAGEAVG